MKPNYVIGISSHYHDSACCLLRDGELIAAAQEERFTRVKHDSRLPLLAFRYCLEHAGISIENLAAIGYYELPHKKLERQLWAGLPQFPPARRDRLLRFDPLRPEREMRELLGYEGQIIFLEHHHSHAASAFYFSGFSEAALLTVDGVGEWATMTYGKGNGSEIRIEEEIHFPHSLGLLYSTITNYLGFEVNEGEYKVMGLAPYGEPIYLEQLRRLITDRREGQFRLALDYFDFSSSHRMFSPKLEELLGQPPRKPESELSEFSQNVARSLQVLLHEVLLEKVQFLHHRFPVENLCMAGGVALNCVANSHILKHGPFKDLFVQPAASDAGGAMGAAMLAHLKLGGVSPARKRLPHVYLGPEYSADEIAALLQDYAEHFGNFTCKEDELIASVVTRLLDGKIIGWFHGRMEFGPRSLGARSILADPRRPEMRDRINALVKKREAFRPFAPAVLLSEAKRHFDLDHASPFMLETCQVTSAVDLPSITHVDGSARVQTVDGSNPRFAKLLGVFGEKTGCPLLLNTSFNVRGEPIVCSPIDALLCFLRSEIDTLVLGDFLLDFAKLPAEWISWFAQTEPKGNQQISRDTYTLF